MNTKEAQLRILQMPTESPIFVIQWKEKTKKMPNIQKLPRFVWKPVEPNPTSKF